MLTSSFVRLREFGHRFVSNERGVVSFEYIIVAALVVAAVTTAFNTNGIAAKLTAGLSAITLVLP